MGEDDCITHCRNLINLLERDAMEFSKSAEYEMLDTYRSILDAEIDEMHNLMHDIKSVFLNC